MKKVFVIIVLAALLCPFASFAQQKVKFGHLDYGEIIKVMPGIDTVQKVVPMRHGVHLPQDSSLVKSR